VKKILSIFILSVFLAMVISGFSGCENKAAPVDSGTKAGASAKEKVKIVLMTRAGLEEDVFRRLIQTYEETTGNIIEIKEISRDSYFTTMSTQLLAGSSELDIALIPNSYIGMLAEAGSLESLSDYLYRDKISSEDFFSLFGYKGNVYLIPTDIITHFLFYRSDLISKPPDTWDEYLKVAKEFTKELNPMSPTKWGASFSGAVEELPKEFNSILWSFDGDTVDENNNIYINNQDSINAGEFIHKLKENKVISPEIFSWSDDDVLTNLVNGTTAMAAPLWNTAYYEIKNGTGKYKDRIKLALIPGTYRKSDGEIYRTPLRYSWTFGINANSLHKEAAWEFLSWFMREEGKIAYVKAGGTPPRLSVLLDPAMQAEHPEFDLLIKSLYIGRTEPSITFYPGLSEVESEAITKILAGNASPKDAFETASQKIQGFIKRKKEN